MASPVINIHPYRRAVVGKIDQFEIKATDADGDQLTYSVDQLPEGLNLIGNVVQGTYINTGTTVSTFSVSDGTNTTTATVTFLVRAQGVGVGENIVLANLTNPPVVATSSPIIGTRSDLRDGTRGGDGGGGDPEPPAEGLYDLSNVQYLGAFTISQNNGGDLRTGYSDGMLGFRPPDGSNGTYGSIYSDSHVYGLAIGEWQIPETLGDPSINNKSNLPSATVLQPYKKIFDMQGATNTYNLNRFYMFGQVVNGRLPISMTIYYRASNESINNTIIINDPKDLENTTTSGWLFVQGEDKACNFMNKVPSEYQSSIGSDWMVGAGGKFAIVGRLSNGPSMYGFDITNYTPGDSSITTFEKMYYPNNDNNLTGRGGFNQLENSWFSGYFNDFHNERAIRHYCDQLGLDTSSSSAYEAWTQTDPKEDWANLTPPATGTVNDLWVENSRACCGFIVPGTKTYLVVGTTRGRRYGCGYKLYYLDGNGPGGGGHALDPSDEDCYYWAYNMDDILSAVNPYDPVPYDWGVWQNNRWLDRSVRYAAPKNKITNGFFDANTRRLYLAQRSGDEGSTIVAVYKI